MAPVPVLGWDASRPNWLASRRQGIGASDVSALLGFSRWQTPWELWAEKTGAYVVPELDSEAILLGHALEPWLIEQAPVMLGQPVTRTPHMMYARDDGIRDWQMASPDAFADDGGLVEAKTAGLAGWEEPQGWEDGRVPLGYEFQARWQMYVMDRPRVHFVALVAGMGRITRTILRDIPLEFDLIQAVSEWRQKHLIDRVEPAIDGRDLDALNHVYAYPDGTTADLSATDALEWRMAYKEGARLKKEGDALQAGPKAQFRAALGKATHGVIDGQLIATWNPTQGGVDYKRMVEDMEKQPGVEPLDPDEYRKPSGRTLLVK